MRFWADPFDLSSGTRIRSNRKGLGQSITLGERYGSWGKLLRIDLTTRKVRTEELADEFFRLYPGGRSLIAYVLLRETRPGVDALSAENPLVFAPGVLTGTPLSGASRYLSFSGAWRTRRSSAFMWEHSVEDERRTTEGDGLTHTRTLCFTPLVVSPSSPFLFQLHFPR